MFDVEQIGESGAHAAHRNAPGRPAIGPGRRRVRTTARRAARALAHLARRSPGSFVYLFVLAITIWLLSSLDSHTADVLLRSVSTNVVQMSRSAPRVLVLSAFVVSGGNLLVFLAQFAVLHLPAERWLGTRRWLAVIVAGHVGASTITTVGIWLLLRSGHEDRALVYPIDVGVSYTLAAAAAALVYRLQRPLRVVVVVGLAVWLRVDRWVTAPTFTDVGHACAFAIGLAVTPLLLTASDGGERVAIPRTVSTRAWWHYVASVAPRRGRRVAGRRTLWVGAAASMLVVAVGFGVLAHASATTTTNPLVSVPAEVVAVERSCAAGCPRMRVAFRYDDLPREVTVPISLRSNARVGASRLVQFRGDHPETAVIGRSTENIDAGGFFSLGAIASLIVAVLAAIAALRDRRFKPRGETDPDGAGTGGASAGV